MTEPIHASVSFVEALARRAKSFAEAHGRMHLRTLRLDASRWRDARLLWPDLFDRNR